ncbi:MAG: hypothetical protein V1749_06035 [Candidatus Desantisbacteria bacterium]
MKSNNVMIGMRTACCVALVTAMIGVSGCSGKPSTRDCRRFVESIAAQEGGYFAVKNFKKVKSTTSSECVPEMMNTAQCTWDQVYLKDTQGGLLDAGTPRKKGEVVHVTQFVSILR